MKRKITKALIGLSFIALTGCVTTGDKLQGDEYYDKKYEYLFVESTDLNTIWKQLDNRLIAYRNNPTKENKEHYMYLFNRYIDRIERRNEITQNYLNSTRQLQVSWGNDGRSGAAELEPGFIHVLGGTPYLPTRYVRPQRTRQSSKQIPPYNLAWSRYCNNGEGMTAQDWKVIHNANYVVPSEYRKNCYPPK